MCLYSKTRIAKKAEKDIEVYKAYVINDENNITTPFAKVPLNPDKNRIVKGKFNKYLTFPDSEMATLIRRLKFFLFKNGAYASFSDHSEIIDGFIHCYTTFEKADMFHLGCDIRHINGYIIYSCLIPKGTYYYLGDNDDICAREIKIGNSIKVGHFYK